MRRTKIVATIGPSSSDEAVLWQMIKAGMDVARLNFSHGTHEEHAASVRKIRRLSERADKPIGIICDLQGPKIRVGELAGSPLELRKGGTLVITTRSVKGAGNRISTTYKRLHHDVKTGDRILLDDGAMTVRIVKVAGRDIHCRVINGGILEAHKGINLPGIKISEPSLTEKDKEDVGFAVKLGVDYFAMSFIRRADDIIRLKDHLGSLGARTPIIAKVEKPEALQHIDEIISVSDGIMVARGDLGVEMSPEKVPQTQQDLIRRSIEAGRLSITATQMLESMIRQPMPTRAEASDVVNAIYDGTGAVMLSGETAVGDYPVESVKMMARIAEEADTYAVEKQKRVVRHSAGLGSFEDAIGQAVETTARNLPARVIACLTTSGFTAQHISSYRPLAPIVAFTQNEAVCKRMSLLWGVRAIPIKEAKTIDVLIANAERELLKRRLAKQGDDIIITAGYPLGVSGTTNLMHLLRMGHKGFSFSKKLGKRG